MISRGGIGPLASLSPHTDLFEKCRERFKLTGKIDMFDVRDQPFTIDSGDSTIFELRYRGFKRNTVDHHRKHLCSG